MGLRLLLSVSVVCAVSAKKGHHGKPTCGDGTFSCEQKCPILYKDMDDFSMTDILKQVCRRDEDCPDNSRSCINCGDIPDMLKFLSDQKGGEDASLEQAREALNWLCSSCVDPIREAIVNQNKPDTEDAFASQCTPRSDCGMKYDQLTQLFGLSDDPIHVACDHGPKAVANQLYAQMKKISTKLAETSRRLTGSSPGAQIAEGPANKAAYTRSYMAGLVMVPLLVAAAAVVVMLRRHSSPPGAVVDEGRQTELL